MLLVDSIYVNMGGGLSLLKYLVATLQEKGVKFRLLVDVRVGEQFSDVDDKVILPPSESSRYKFYTKFPQDVTSVFCFGNVPPPVKLSVPVYTYFHNINMLTLADCKGWKQLLKFWMKRFYIKCLSRNTDMWFVQTDNTANELIKNLRVDKAKVELYPFYKIPHIKNNECERVDYVFIGEDTGSKGHKELILAWELLHEQGFNRTLHLTVSARSSLYKEIEVMKNKGIDIKNHGLIPISEVFSLYSKSVATIYPSRNESLGLGLIEAMEMGCDVIAPCLPYVYAVCQPSATFQYGNPESIVRAILKYERGQTKTQKLVSNTINKLIERLITFQTIYR